MPDPDDKPRYLDIAPLGEGRRLRGLIGYVLLVLAVASLLVYLFVRFTGSTRLAIVLVGFMLTYMLVMGWIASRKEDDRNL